MCPLVGPIYINKSAGMSWNTCDKCDRVFKSFRALAIHKNKLHNKGSVITADEEVASAEPPATAAV
jgi:hypothetical protein